MKRACRSFSSSFGVVPEEISAWNPDRAPHAMVTNRNGNSEPGKTGPSERDAKTSTAGAVISGRTTTMAIASSPITPIFMKVER
jgi:hypothetical protein